MKFLFNTIQGNCTDVLFIVDYSDMLQLMLIRNFALYELGRLFLSE